MFKFTDVTASHVYLSENMLIVAELSCSRSAVLVLRTSNMLLYVA